MVEFGKKLLTSRVEQWKEYYIDYDALKTLIKEAVKARHQKKQHLKEHANTDDIALIENLTTRMINPMRNRMSNVSLGASNTNLNGILTTNLNTINANRNTTSSDGNHRHQYEYVPILEFRRMLDHEIQKIVLFVLTREGQLAERLYELSKDGQILKGKVVSLMQGSSSSQYYKQANGNNNSDNNTEMDYTTGVTTSVLTAHLKSSTDRHREFAKDMLQFVNFMDINLTGLRKILKKHDKNFPHHQLSGLYLHPGNGGVGARNDDRELDGETTQDSHLDKLYYFGGLSALALTLRRAFDDLHLLELHLLTLKNSDCIGGGGGTDSNNAVAITITAPTEREYDEPQSSSSNGYGSATTITCQREPILDQIKAARNRLRQTTKYAELVAAQALIFFDDKDDDDTQERLTDGEFSAGRKLSSMLNLVSTFLYMTNYYVVAPSAGNYALRLGSDESMSGYIIGMTPNAALIATILYGFWSNYSYRNALIFAALSCFCGNIFYALALKYNSISMVLLGRFLVGFGSARSINRRYIADVFSKSDRTAASADFVSYAALGMAAGPATAFGVGHLTFDDSNLLWSDVNASSWIMVGIWGIFVITLVAFFEEPDRSHMYKNTNSKVVDDAASTTPSDVIVTKTNSSYEGRESENEPLLPERSGDIENNNESDTKKSRTKKEPPLWKNVPVMVSLWMYFVLKLVLEMLMSSSSTVTKYYFSWDSKQSGLFMACVALLMFPVNFVVAKLSQKYEDRELIAAILLVMLVSVLGVIDYDSHSYSDYQYIIFGVGIFLSTNGLEGINMSLLSKTIPNSWAKGTFNSGFLATEAGTFARSAGDALISAVAGILGIDMLLNGLFAPMALLCAISLLMVYISYDKLTDMDDDDDDTPSTGTVSSETSLSQKA